MNQRWKSQGFYNLDVFDFKLVDEIPKAEKGTIVHFPLSKYKVENKYSKLV